MIRTAILGASGYVGGELLRLLAAHPQLRATKLFGESKAGRPVAETHPHLAPFYAGSFEKFEEAALADVDLVFAALPHGHSQDIASAILERGIPFVDPATKLRAAQPLEGFPEQPVIQPAGCYQRRNGQA